MAGAVFPDFSFSFFFLFPSSLFGDYTYRGNPVVYGSVVCGGDYDAGGTPSIHYNIELENGEPQPISTRARILRVTIQ